MPSDDDDLREIEDSQNLPGNTVEATDEDSGGSLTTDEGNDPRKAFLDQFTDDNSTPVEDSDEEVEDDENSEEDDDTNVEPQDGDDSDDTKESDEQTDIDSDDDEDEDDEDLGIDFSDLDLNKDDDEEGDPEFDPRSEVSKKVWKSTPKEAQQLITSHRRHAKRLERDAKADKPFADWSRNLLNDAKKANTNTEEVQNLIEQGFRLNVAKQQGRPDLEAAEYFGQIALNNGFRFEVEQPEVDLTGVQSFLQEQITEEFLDIELAKSIMKQIQSATGKHSEAVNKATQKAIPAGPQRNWQNPETNEQYEAETKAAFDTIETMNERFQKRFPNNWDKIAERVKRDVQVEQATTPVSSKHWAALWKKHADKHAKAFLKKSKASKGRNRMKGTSDSLGRGAPVTTDDSKPKNARNNFLDEYTT